MLSKLARFFDLGFLAPVSFFAKYLIQYLWTLVLEWDQSLPANIIQCLNQYKQDLHSLFPLYVLSCVKPWKYKSGELHGFCDGSEKGYAAVFYLRFVTPDDNVIVSFVCAKSKVAPLKRISLLRLELCTAVLLSNLVEFIAKTYSEEFPFHNTFA